MEKEAMIYKIMLEEIIDIYNNSRRRKTIDPKIQYRQLEYPDKYVIEVYEVKNNNHLAIFASLKKDDNILNQLYYKVIAEIFFAGIVKLKEINETYGSS